MLDFVAFDVETTGTTAGKDKIVEIAAVRFIDGKVADTHSELVDPGMAIPADATRVHGITDEMVKGKTGIEAALERFSEFCGTSTLVAHNARFDVKFLGSDFKKSQVAPPGGIVLDTYSIAKQAISELLNHRLNSLVKHFGIGSEGFHRAEQDSVYCGQVLIALVKHIADGGKEPPFENLVNLSGGEIRFPLVEPKAQQLNLLSGF